MFANDVIRPSQQNGILLKTHRLRWERIQEFELPIDCICTSLAVNPIMGEIMFACRNKGLLHYEWSRDSGVIYANKPCRVSYSEWGNVRLVNCEQDTGNYTVVNDQTLALVTIGYQKLAPTGPMARRSIIESDPGTLLVKRGGRRGGRDSGGLCVDFESERCVVGDVRAATLDTENERLYLLYRDKLCRRIYPDMRHYSSVVQSGVNRCIGSELVCLALSRNFLYVLTKSGDIKVRLKLESMTDTNDQLAWRAIGHRLLGSVQSSKMYKNVAMEIRRLGRKKIDISAGKDEAGGEITFSRVYDLQSTEDAQGAAESDEGVDVLAAMRHRVISDRATGIGGYELKAQADTDAADTDLVELVGTCVDSRRNILFASTGQPGLYAMWQLNASQQDTGRAGWISNWLEDDWLDLSGPPPAKPLVPGPVACVSLSSRKPGYLYTIDRQNCRRVMVIRYSTEPVSVAASSGSNIW